MTALIITNIPRHAKKIRVHVNGDFFSQTYFDAWMGAARARPDVLFWAFTKSLKFWESRLQEIPSNFTLQASYGGKDDHLIESLGLKFAKVVYSKEEAGDLPLDFDDSHAMTGAAPFALLLHGQQPKGSSAAAAVQADKLGFMLVADL